MFYKETEFQESPIGKIPKDWEIAKLEDVMENVKGRKPARFLDEKSENSLPYLTAEYMRSKSSIKWCEKDDPNIVKVNESNLIMIWDGSYSGDVFTGFAGVLASTMVKITPDENLNAKFLYHFLTTKFDFLRGTTSGTGIPHVSKSIFENLPVPIPCVEEQRLVVGVLGVVDSAIGLVDRVIWKTERLKKGLMQTLLTKGIGHKEYKDTPIGKIPKEWDVLPCSELCREITVGIVVTPAKYYTSSGIPCLRSFNIQENEINPRDLVYISPEANMLHKKSILHTGDIVAVRTGQPGTASVVPPAFDGANCVDLIIFRPNDKIRSDFMSCFLNSPVAKRQITAGQTGSVQQHFNIGMTQKLKISIPPLHEQAKIASTVYLAHKKLKLALEEKTRLQRVKRGLMDLLLTGKIRIKVS